MPVGKEERGVLQHTRLCAPIEQDSSIFARWATAFTAHADAILIASRGNKAGLVHEIAKYPLTARHVMALTTHAFCNIKNCSIEDLRV